MVQTFQYLSLCFLLPGVGTEMSRVLPAETSPGGVTRVRRAETKRPSHYPRPTDTKVLSSAEFGYSSTCHERTPSGPGKSIRTLQVAAHQRDGWAVVKQT